MQSANEADMGSGWWPVKRNLEKNPPAGPETERMIYRDDEPCPSAARKPLFFRASLT